MNKAAKWTGISVVGLALAVLGGGMLISPEWEVTRSIVIDADPAVINAQVDDFEKWPAWSSFDKDYTRDDPTYKVTMGQTSRGVGATRSWVSGDGPGKMTVTKSDPATGCSFKLEFADYPPVEGEFVYKAVEGGTEVTWTDRGNMGANPIGRWMGLLMPGMIGEHFERSLADLKTIAEGGD